MKALTLDERKQWEQERHRKNDQLLKQLSEGIANLNTEPAWREYLATQKMFCNYSASNVLLLAIQAAERSMPLSRVAGYSTWKALHRQVRRGERGLIVFAPMTMRSSEDPGDTKGESEDESERLLFKAVRVFELSQTEGKPLPEPVKLLQGEDINGSFARLQKVAESEGLTVYREELKDDIRGYYQSSRRRIVVDRNLPGAQSVKTLAHELGHHFLDHTSYAEGSRQDCELEAESVAFIVAGDSLVGISTGDYSFGYVVGWQENDPKQAEQKIRECAGRIQRASKGIIERLEEVVQEECAVADEEVVRQSVQRRNEALRTRGNARTR